MAEPRPATRRVRIPRGLGTGALLVGALTLLAVTAPLIATDRPWLARTDDGRLAAPAFAAALGLGPPPFIEVVLAAPVPHAPNAIDLDEVLAPPSARHWMGTDALGRDLTARVVHGARVSVVVGLLSAGFAMLLGIPAGALAGYRGGWVDAVVSRVLEGFLCFPNLLLILVILATAPVWLAGLSDVLRVALVLGVTGWMAIARYLRGEFIKLRSSDMVAAAHATGGGHLRVAVRHILPCSLAPVLVTASFAVGGAIALEAALSFLGLGVRPPVATWGGMLFDAREQVDRAWWLALFPGAAIFLAVLACNLVGEGIRDLLDPRRDPR